MVEMTPEKIKQKLERPSTFASKMKQMPPGWEPPPSSIPVDPEVNKVGTPGYYGKHYIFFYGTLMDKDILARVLGLSPDDERLKLRPARIAGYHVKFWGPYPALLYGPRKDSRVDGMIYWVQSQDEIDRLSAYETDKYMLDNCIIHFLDVEEGEKTRGAIGKTFIWNGNPEGLAEGKPV